MRIPLRDGVADLRARKIWRQGSIARLSSAEVEVLGLLMSRAGETVERDEILVRALGHAPTSVSRAVDLCVHRLRQKLEVEPARPVHLITAQGEGYRLLPAEDAAEPRSNLPRPRDGLVGRDRLVEEGLAALVRGPLAIVGPAGVGKTTIALRVAALAARTLTPAGSFWVDASAVADEIALVQAVARAAGLQADTVEALRAGLEARGPTLIAIDTCERALAAVAAVVAMAADGALVLLTSRVAVPGASTLEVGPLTLEEAQTLLIVRAREAGYRGELPPERIARVVEAVDRLPLGIELAAARLPAMSLARIEQELVNPLRLLRGRASGRQASVEASVRWSWDALAEADRERLIRIAVFRVPVPIAVAAAMIGEDAVERLVGAYLLRRVDGALTPWHAVGELAQRIAPPEAWAAARRAHARWVSEQATKLVPALWTREFPVALAELERLESDLALAEEIADDPVDLALAQCELDLELGRSRAAGDRVDRVLARIPADHPGRPALMATGAAALAKQSRYEEAIARAQLASTLAIRPEDRMAAAYTVATANLRLLRKEAGKAATALTWQLAADDPVLRARAYGAAVLADALDWPGEAGLRTLEAAVRAAEDAGAVRVVAVATHNLAVGYHRLGRRELAEAMYLRSTTLLARNRRACGIAWNNLAVLRLARDPEGSLRASHEGFVAFGDAGAADGQRVAIGLSALAHAMLGETVDALADADEAASRLDGVTSATATQTRALRAGIYATLGRTETAAALFAEVAPRFAEDLTLTDDDAWALLAAWTSDRALEADRAERLEQVEGDRRWIQVQLLRRAGRVQRPSTQSSRSSPT